MLGSTCSLLWKKQQQKAWNRASIFFVTEEDYRDYISGVGERNASEKPTNDSNIDIDTLDPEKEPGLEPEAKDNEEEQPTTNSDWTKQRNQKQKPPKINQSWKAFSVFHSIFYIYFHFIVGVVVNVFAIYTQIVERFVFPFYIVLCRLCWAWVLNQMIYFPLRTINIDILCESLKYCDNAHNSMVHYCLY